MKDRLFEATAPVHPACFTLTQYRSWNEAAAARYGSPGPSDYCTDCQPGFKAQMKAAGRCEHPETTFELDAEDCWVGTRQTVGNCRQE